MSQRINVNHGLPPVFPGQHWEGMRWAAGNASPLVYNMDQGLSAVPVAEGWPRGKASSHTAWGRG